MVNNILMGKNNNKLYFAKDLRLHLKKLGLPCSRPTLVGYESEGIIPKPEKIIKLGNNKARVYSWKMIERIAEIIKSRQK